MASSDDEGEPVPHTVSNYHFVDDKDEPISFAELPVQWNEGESPDCKRKQIFLHGNTDNGLQKIYKQVKAWKFDLSEAKPEISVLYRENNWIKLQEPRKSFKDTIRTILIAVHFLHLVKKNPETSRGSLWNHLSKIFSLYETRPSENDLVDHSTLISEAVKRDENLAKSKFLVTFLKEMARKKKAVDEDVGTTAKSGFVVGDDEMMDKDEEDESDEESDLFDCVCAICDNGGDLLCCEGRCMRSFHATVEAGSESVCESLGFSDEQVEAIQKFFCKNCQYKQHQCFSCGELGSSDKSSGAEVFSCVSATCGRFYHPHCVAKLLHHESETDAEELQKKIAAGESFTCPIHKCHVCKQGENKIDPELQFAVCRRCPKSYHRKCLPRKIAFRDLEDEGIVQRAWEGLIPDRILIYCLKHEIDDDELGTPIRNHIKFPKIAEKKKNQASALLSSREKLVSKRRSLASEDAPRKRAVEKAIEGVEKLSSAIKEADSSKKRERRLSGPVSSKKQKVMDTSRKPSNKTASMKVSKFTTDEGGTSLGESLYAMISNSEVGKSRKENKPDSERKQTLTAKLVAKETFSSLPLDADTKRRIMVLMKDASSSITQEQIIKRHKVPLTHACSSNYLVDKAITLGKVEGSVEALRAALQKLEEGCSIEDAKAVCEPGLLNQIIKWKNKLKVYLAPFLYGMRYTSFGRHFTKVDKLKEIVDMLHWYVGDGDMIVDFCCGANEFSCLMKKKLDETGKNCSYKNYDIFQTKNDFNFEKRDWMSIHPKELPTGSELIMGLNPPFGVNATLANKFIDKALEFKPKLLIIMVPRETERLDKKKSPYDLVWEDDELLAGKSFYLPGSVDVNDKQMDQWNMNPPPLYLWSRPDWTAKHKAIAEQHGHTSRAREESQLEENHRALFNDYPLEHHGPNGEMCMVMDDHPIQNEETEQLQQRGASVTGCHKEGFTCNNSEREGNVNHDQGKNQSGEKAEKRQHDKGKRKRWKGSGEIAVEYKQNARSSPLTCNNGEREGNENHDQGKNQSGENAEKRQRDKGKRKCWKGSGEIALEDKQNARSSPLTCNNGEREGNENHDQGKNQSGENAENRQRDKGKRKHGKESGGIALEDKQKAQSSPLTCNNGEREGNENHDQGKSQSGENAENKQRDKGKRKHGKESGEIALEDKQKAQSSALTCNNGEREGNENHDQGKNQSGENAENRQRDKGKRKHGKESGEIALEDKQKAQSSPLTCNNGEREGNENHDQGKNQSGENAENRQRDKGKRKHGKESGEIALEDKQNAQSSPLTCNNGEREGNENHDQGKNQSGENAETRQHDKGKRKHGKESGEIALEDKQNAQSSPVSGLFKGMSRHSPPKVTGDKSLDGHQSNFLKTSLQTEVGKEGYWHPNHSSAGPVPQFQMGYGGTQADDLEKKSSLNSQETHSGASPGRDYEVRSTYLAGRDLGFSSHCGHLDSAAGSSYSRMNASTMQRYSPRLDELNHTRMNSSRFEPPSASRNGIYDPLASRPGFLADSFGFAPGPYRLFSPQNSSGWLDE